MFKRLTEGDGAKLGDRPAEIDRNEILDVWFAELHGHKLSNRIAECNGVKLSERLTEIDRDTLRYILEELESGKVSDRIL